MTLSSASINTYLRHCILSALGLFAFCPAIAANVNDNPPQVELDEIVVTATRTPTKISNTIAQTRVIDSEALKRYQGQSALDVIKRQPGFSHYSSGGAGTTSNFFMRGYGSNQILVLIDGVRYSSISAGGASLSLLPADQIERIEVLYGASGSSIYGADAMGGVIQIFTKGQNVEQNQFSVTAGVGSNDEYLYGATAQFVNDTGTSLGLSASHNETDGINATLPSNFNYYPDDDGFESDNFSLALTQRINEQWLAGASALYSKSTTEYDYNNIDDVYSDQKNGAVQAFVDWRYRSDSSVKLQYGHSIDESDNPAYDNYYDTKQDQVSLVGQHQLPIGKGIYGAEYLKQSLDSNISYDVDDRDITSAFLGYVLADAQFDAQANVRFDDYSKFGDETTYNLGGAYNISPDLRLGANYAKGFRAPTFNDLYYPDSGNPDLDPETSDNYEIFAEYDTAMQSTRLTGYYNKVDDLITFVSRFDDENNYIGGSSQNVGKAKIKGVTLTSDWMIDDYLFGASYDYQKAEDDSGANNSNDGNFLAFRPEHKGLVYVGYQLPSLSLRAEYEYIDDYYSDPANTDAQRVDGYGLLNISGNYQLHPNLSLTARLNNITNKEYVTIPGYNTDGTNFFTSLTYNWY